MKEIEREIVIRRYLLGDLNDKDREQVEMRLITDRDYKEEVLIVEEELLDDYVSDALVQRERDLFHNHYLSTPLQRQKLRIAQALDKYAAQGVAAPAEVKGGRRLVKKLSNVFRSRKLLMQLSWATLIFVVLGGTWWVFKNWRSGTNDLEAELVQLNGPGSSVLEPGPSVLQAVLPPLSFRESRASVTVTITKETQIVQLRIPHTSERQQGYLGALKDSNGNEVVKVDGLMARNVDNAKMLVLQLPVRVFETGDYVVSIREPNAAGVFEETGNYSFRVLR